MAVLPIADLKALFVTGAKPTQANFEDLIDTLSVAAFYVADAEKMRLTAAGLAINMADVTADADPSAALDVVSTTQGTRPAPTMTKAQRDAIVSPADGLMVNQSDGTAGLKVCVGGAWFSLDTTADP